MLSQTVIYALRIMGFIASQKGEGPVLAQTISEEMKIPKNFLSKIAHKLVQSGLLKSTRGLRGGFTLAKPAKQTSLKDVAAIFMNVNELDQCFLFVHDCNRCCHLHEVWSPIVNDFKKMLEENTIDQIFSKSKNLMN